MDSSKRSAVVGIALALTGLFAGAAEVRLTGPELVGITQGVVHSVALANTGTRYGQCVSENFELKNNAPVPPKYSFLGSYVTDMSTQYNLNRPALQLIVTKFLQKQCGGHKDDQ